MDLAQKINQIYDAIDTRNFKLAIQLADKAKSSNDLLLALKSLALANCRRFPEAYTITTALLAKPSLDLNTISALLYTFKQDYSKTNVLNIVTLFKKAVKDHPRDVDLNTQYFNALVRADDWKAMATQASRMKALAPSNPNYLWWSICLAVIQGREDPSSIYLTLAEKMCEKAIEDSNLFFNKEHLLTYLELLEVRGKRVDMVKLMEGEDVKRCFKLAGDCNMMTRRVIVDGCLNGEDAKKVLKLARKMLVNRPDDWTAIRDLNGATLANPDFIESTRELLRDLREVNPKARGPFLGEVDLEFRLNMVVGSELFEKSVLVYFETFGHAYCLFEDLKPYLSIVGDPMEFVDLLSRGVSEKTGDNINQHANLAKMKRFWGIGGNSFSEFMEGIFGYYLFTVPFGVELDGKEKQLGDDYILIMAHACVDEYKESKETKYLHQAICVLEYGLAKSAYNYQIKILLLRTYYEVGVYLHPLKVHVPTLEIKQIMLDSMSWVYTEGLEILATGAGGLEDVITTVTKTLQIYARNEIEVADMIILAYDKGSYSKVFEFMKFRGMLRDSVQQTISRRLIVRTEIRARGVSGGLKAYLESLEDIWVLGSGAVDNRDKEVLVNWSGKETSVSSLLRGQDTPGDRKDLVSMFGAVPFFLRNAYRGSGWRGALQDVTADESLIGVLRCICDVLGDVEEGNGYGKLRNILDYVLTTCGGGRSINNVGLINFGMISDLVQIYEVFLYACIGLDILKSKNWCEVVIVKKKKTYPSEIVAFANELSSILDVYGKRVRGLVSLCERKLESRDLMGQDANGFLFEEAEAVYTNVKSHIRESWTATFTGLVSEIDHLGVTLTTTI